MEREIQRSWFTLKLFLYTTNGVFLRLYKDAKSGKKRTTTTKKKKQAKKKWWSDFLNLIRKEFEKRSIMLRKKLDNKFTEHQHEHEL